MDLTDGVVDEAFWDSIPTTADGSIIDPDERGVRNRRDIHYVKVANDANRVYFYVETYALGRTIDRPVHILADVDGDSLWDYDIVWYSRRYGRDTIRVYNSGGSTVFYDTSGDYVDDQNGKVEFAVPLPPQYSGITVGLSASTRDGIGPTAAVIDQASDSGYRDYTTIPELSLPGRAALLMFMALFTMGVSRGVRRSHRKVKRGHYDVMGHHIRQGGMSTSPCMSLHVQRHTRPHEEP